MAIAGEKQASVPSRRTVKPELLAPAGDRTCMIAAVENGADAIYFGLQRHNARARATNFDGAELPSVMNELHRRGVRGYVTLNTLVFPGELEGLEETLRHLVESGVDAVIVQDLGLVRLIRALTPDLEVHASTQMSITSTEGVRLAEELGCSRVILARELSLKEIGRVASDSPLPLEVFVHGALCVAYSGQCLTSEALGGRSANRGECAQACRMPYEIICDGEPRDLEDVKYLLSPRDLAAYDLVPQLIDLGVASLKIEGRLKSPEYVANMSRHYRRAIDEAWEGEPTHFSPRDVQEMELSFSRGFSHGFLDGNNHKVLVRGDYAKKRGIFLGRVTSVVGAGIRLNLAAEVKPGDGLVFDAVEGDQVPEQGGRVYEVRRVGRAASLQAERTDRLSEGPAELRFGQRDLDPRKVRPGQRVWKTDDPELTKKLRKSFEGNGSGQRKVPIDLQVHAVEGEPLRLSARTSTGRVAEGSTATPLERAERHPASLESLREQLDRFGSTLYQLRDLAAHIEGAPLVPRSLLNALRRKLVDQLEHESDSSRPRANVAAEPVVPALRPIREPASPISVSASTPPPTVSLTGLCRTNEQIAAAVASGLKMIYADFQDIKGYREAVSLARGGGAEIYLATPRIQKPFESNLFRYLQKQRPDGLLVRNAGGLEFCTRQSLPYVADFSLNAANELTVAILKERGAKWVTASYDLSFDQLEDLIQAVPRDWLEVVIHQRIPMFHMEHCVFCAFLSPGTDKTNCGRPCDEHEVKLRDRVGKEHPLTADVGCRNTLFNAVAQSAAEYLPRMLTLGTRHLRVEFLEETGEQVTRTVELYSQAISGEREARSIWRELKATSRYGVTRGALALL